jgi:cyclase
MDLSPPGNPRIEEVSDGVFAYIQPDGTWFINNTGFVVGTTGVTSIDACSTERRTRAYLEAIRTVSSQPVRTLVNTHHHGDHTNGNYPFPGATIVGQDGCRAATISAGAEPPPPGVWQDVEWGSIELAPAFLTFKDSIVVWADDLACEVNYVGQAAHTTNDSVIWLPKRSVFCGDLVFNGGTPFVLMGSVEGAIDVLDNVVAPLGAVTIVPGHGGVCGPEVIADTTRYLKFVLATAKAGMSAGLSPLEVAMETDLAEYSGLSDPERIVGNLHRAYAELSGTPRGGRMDIGAAIGDMVAYNGGRPLTCRA